MTRRVVSSAVISALVFAVWAGVPPPPSGSNKPNALHSVTGPEGGGFLLRARILRFGDQLERHAPPVGVVPPSFAVQPPPGDTRRLLTSVDVPEHALTADRTPRGPPLSFF